ncbi:MAG TPA: MMPL family transporter, partial [Solirubrobacteraceae bacterium]|nr:MMPL family transporter [Solirubrobacteraceae bacterium]
MSARLGALAGRAARHPRAVLGLAALLVLAGAALSLGLRTSAGTDTLVDRSSGDYRATQTFYNRFGQDAVEVLVRGSLHNTLLTGDLERLVGLEGCLSGNLPAAAIRQDGGPRSPCGGLSRAHVVKVVIGPGTYINEAVGVLQSALSAELSSVSSKESADAAAAYKVARAHGYSTAQAHAVAGEVGQAVSDQAVQGLVAFGASYNLTTYPAVDNPATVTQIAFEPGHPGVPKERLAYILPDSGDALISVRLRNGLSDHAQAHAIALIRAATAMPRWHLQHGQRMLVTGVPVVISDLAGKITGSLERLLVGVLLVMALALALVFRRRLPLLPLALALGAAALTFGGLALVGAPLTMASIGVLPVLVGLAVDYAIQFQSRALEGEAHGLEGRLATVARVRRAAARGGPTILTAAAATAAGFAALALSPVPMVRGFGYLLIAGVALALVLTITAGSAALAWTPRGGEGRLLAPVRALAPAWRGAGEIVYGNRAARSLQRRAPALGARALGGVLRRPRTVLLVALALAAAGWALDSHTHVQTDITKLVPQNLPALRNLNTLERSTGVGGEIDVMVRSADLLEPRVVHWMAGYQNELDRRFGYTPERGCGAATLCPAFSLTDLFSGGTAGLTATEIKGLIELIPSYFSQSVITADHHTANLAFGIRLMPLSRQEQVVAAMRAALHPPAGVSAHLAGITVLAADAAAAVTPTWRRLETLLAGLGAVALVLLLALRRPRRALVPLVPIVLASGWSALVIFCVRIPLNPMSVTLGALVVAISTEFSVLLAERYRQERLAGADPASALRRTYSSTGAAVVASGVTAIAGFAILVLSDITMLRDFGAVT